MEIFVSRASTPVDPRSQFRTLHASGFRKQAAPVRLFRPMNTALVAYDRDRPYTIAPPLDPIDERSRTLAV